MLIAVDFDGTFASDPTAWIEALRALVTHGHQVVMVTQRNQELGGDVLFVWPAEWPIVWAGGLTKRSAARNAGLNPDVWIDDRPSTVDLIALTYMGG